MKAMIFLPSHSTDLSKNHPISSNIIQYHPISSNIIQYHPISSNIIQYHPISSNIILISSNIIQSFRASVDQLKIFCFPHQQGITWITWLRSSAAPDDFAHEAVLTVDGLEHPRVNHLGSDRGDAGTWIMGCWITWGSKTKS